MTIVRQRQGAIYNHDGLLNWMERGPARVVSSDIVNYVNEGRANSHDFNPTSCCTNRSQFPRSIVLM